MAESQVFTLDAWELLKRKTQGLDLCYQESYLKGIGRNPLAQIPI
jgi:hypothetical protein